MSPLKSSLAKTAKQLLGLRNTADLGLRGATQNKRTPPPLAAPFTANIVMMGAEAEVVRIKVVAAVVPVVWQYLHLPLH